MSILAFEFVSGGGLWRCRHQPRPVGSLLVEGIAMAQALVEDLAASSHAPVIQFVDVRAADNLPPVPSPNVNRITVSSRSSLESLLRRHAGNCDWAIVIAPESDGMLHWTHAEVLSSGVRLIGCDQRMLEWAADKQATVERLAEFDVPTPSGFASLGKPMQIPELPVVVKPGDGAGSEDTHVVQCQRQWDAIPWKQRSYRIERFHGWQPASIAAICGPNERQLLAPCLQFVDTDPAVLYRGGRVLGAGNLANRIRALGKRSLAAFDGACGFVGIDMILGDASDGSQDIVIEINPRLTTSYVGLRAATHDNLAQSMLDAAIGKTVDVQFPCVPVDFRTDGRIVTDAALMLDY